MYYKMPKSSGVYALVNLDNGKMYIGFSNNIHRRCCEHYLSLKHNTHQNIILQDAWNCTEHWEFKVVEETDDSAREEYWTRFYNTHINGYNIKIGTRTAESTKVKMSLAQVGIPKADSTRHKMSIAKTGTKLSDATKTKLSMIRTYKSSVRQRIQLMHQGKDVTDLTRYINSIQSEYYNLFGGIIR